MKMKLTALSLILLFSSTANGQKTTIWVTAVTHNSNLVTATSTYQTPGQSQENCNGTATTIGNTTNGTANCNGTYTAPQQHNITVSRLDVVDRVRTQNGQIYTIVCSAHWVGSNCSPLIDGDTFPAEIDGSTMWIGARKGGNQGKEVKVKYKILDIRQLPQPISVASASKDVVVAGFPQVSTPAAVGPLPSNDPQKDPAPSAAQPRSSDKGTIILVSTPAGGEVYVDSVFVGNTPANLKLTAGEHFIRVFADGYNNWSRNITVISDSEENLSAILDKKN
jgi:hypothetical protein